MEPIAIASLVIILATITLPLAVIGLTLWMGGASPMDEEADTAHRA